jgi:hypothetical protein
MEGSPLTESSIFGGDVPTADLDLVLAVVLAFGLPFACAWLFGATGGALAGLLLYYVGGCIVVVRWRKGTLDYRRPARWPWALFGAGLVLVAIITATNAGAYPDYGAPPLGLAITALVWAPLNGALEQLSWQYVLDAWRNRWPAGRLRWVGATVGIVLILALVALIHLLFWTLFLPVKSGDTTPWTTPVLNSLLTAVYVLLYYQSRSMWPTFAIHTLVDLQLVLLANYSILPDL